ncbi:MAG TPA: tetratricopeptide repeat protein [Stellaceae bacterium]|nr:tetratricopeptide repeat protein [Stellaceae bacterium]
MSDIFREIDEELRRDNWLKLWQRYGKYVIALAVVAVAATALVVGWREYQLRQRQAEGVRYAAALDLAQRGKDKDAADAFAAVAQNSKAGRAILARFEEAALDTKSGDGDSALAIYDAIAKDGAADRTYRDLATLLAARIEMTKNPKGAADRLQPLTDAANPWHATALELSAVAALQQGDKAGARALYQRLADDLAAPQGARARAAEMVAALGQ